MLPFPSLGACLVPNFFPVAAALIKKVAQPILLNLNTERRRQRVKNVESNRVFFSFPTDSIAGEWGGGEIVIHAGIESRELLLPSERARYCPEFA